DRRRLLSHCDCRVSRRDDDIHFAPHILGCDLSEPPVKSLSPPILDCNVSALGPTEFAQLLNKTGVPLALASGRARAQDSDDRQFPGLGPRCQRPQRRRAAEQRDELAPPHVEPPPPESVHRILSLP